MNIHAPRPAFPVPASVVDVSVQPIRTAPTALAPLSSYSELPSFGRNSKGTDPVEHHRMSPIPEGVAHPNILLFTHPRALGRSSSTPSTEMSDITVFELDSSYLYHCLHYSSFIV